MRILQSSAPEKVIHTGLAILLVVCAPFSSYVRILLTSRTNQAAKGAHNSYDGLLELLESIERLLRPLDIYSQIPHTLAMDEMVAKIMAELLSALGLATKELKQGRSSESVHADMLS